MADILLVVPPLYPHELFARGSEASASKLPTLGLAYLAGYLRAHGHRPTIVDGIAAPVPVDELAATFHKYDVVGVTAISAYAVRCAELLQAAKRLGVRAPLVAGGPHVTAMPEHLLRHGAGWAVLGEGERTMLELVDCLAAGRSPTEIPGLAYLDGDALMKTGRRAMIDPLDEVPLPARDLLPMHLYSTSPARSKNYPSHSMFTSWGCPGACTFCDKRTFGGTVRHFGLERIVEEFFTLRDVYGARDVSIWDDNFTSNKDLLVAVCDQLNRREFKLTWNVESRINMVDRDILTHLKGAGCSFIAYGIESGSQRVLDHAHKGITKEEIREKVRMTKEVGIPIRGYFMVGLPGETAEDIRQTIDFAVELDIEVATFTLFLPLPGTADYTRALKSGTFKDPEYFLRRIIPEFNFPDQATYIPEGLTERELLDLHKSAYSRYYFRPSMIVRKLGEIRSLEDVKTLVKSGMNVLKHAMSG